VFSPTSEKNYVPPWDFGGTNPFFCGVGGAYPPIAPM